MQLEKRLRQCPVCAGPFIHGEGGAGCVVCGHALQFVARQHRTLSRSQKARRPRPPVQLVLPLVAIGTSAR